MANLKYYCDTEAGAAELTGIHGLDNSKFAARFPAVKGRRFDGYAMLVGHAAGSRDVLPVTRTVEYKSHPSRHECDDRCMNATGKVMRCECSCGGKNHGRGSALCAIAAQPAF